MPKILLILIICIFLLIPVSCGKSQKPGIIVTTIHPFKLILQEITGPDIPVHNLMPASASPHTFRLRPSDLTTLENAPFIFAGGNNLDNWAGMLPVSSLIELSTLVPKEFILRFDDELQSIDPHFWTDPLAVRAMLPALQKQLLTQPPIDSALIQSNIIHFSAALLQLYTDISTQVADFKGSALVLSHPFFRYYMHRFGFRIAGVIETQPGNHPTPKLIEKMIGTLGQKNAKLILTHPAHSDGIAQLLSEATQIPVCQLDPLGMNRRIVSYHDLIRHNTRLLLESLK